ncbi:MAG: DUF6514 family protein [Oscillospiraceae bacterium]|nr:DUF6514 family protein [Oscillospiraceae bacterium]
MTKGEQNTSAKMDIRGTDTSVWRYHVVPETAQSPELGRYHTYGIRVEGAGYDRTTHDVAVSRETAARIAALCNRNGLSPVHFRDILDDLLP